MNHEEILQKTTSDSPLVVLGRTVGVKTLHIVLHTLGGARGMQVYIPTTDCFFKGLYREIRDANIYRKMKMGNASNLAKEYGITEARIRQICATQRKEARLLWKQKSRQ